MAGGGPQTYRVDIFDPENFMCRQTLIQGGLISDKVHSVVYEALGNDKCICRIATEYHPREGVVYLEMDIYKVRDL